MAFLNNHPDVFTSYLKSSVGTLKNRLIFEKSKRPLIANIDDNDLAEFIAKHLFERSKYYNQAQWNISVDDLPLEEVVSKIQFELDEHNF